MVWPVWVVQAIWFVATTIISIALAPRPPNRKAASLEDFTIPTAEEGRAIPVVFGTVRITGPNVVWYGDLDKVARKKSSLFGSSQTIGFKYYLGLHYVLSFGPIDELLRWEWDDKTAWAGSRTTSGSELVNLPKLFGGKNGEGGLIGEFDLEMGEQTQTPNGYLVSKIGAPLSAFRGVTSVVWHGTAAMTVLGLSGGYVGQSQYLKPCTFTVRRTAAGWEDGVCWNPADVTIDGGMNPAHVVYEILTNSNFGYGEPTASIDETSFGEAADQFVAENFGINLQWVNSEELESFLGEICSHAGMVLTEDPTTGKYVLKLLRDNYVDGDLDLVDESTAIELIRYSRQGWGETVNEVTILYTDPVSFKTTGVTVHDLGNIQSQGRVISQSVPFPGIRNHDVAAAVASRELAQRSTPLGRGTIRCSRRAWHYQQGDVFRFSWEKEGLSEVVHRVMAIRKGTLEDGSIEIDIAEDIFGIDSATYTAATSVDSVPAQPAEPASDASTGGNVLSATTTAPPGSPADGDSYYVPTGATGAWVGHEGEVATWDEDEAAWQFEAVDGAPVVYVDDTGDYATLDGTGGSSSAPWATPLTTDGDLLTRAGGVLARIPIGSNDQVLKVVSGAPAWAADGGGGGGGPSGSNGALAYVGETVLGSAAASITSPTIDLDADSLYYFELIAQNALGTAPTAAFSFNADTTAGNYSRVRAIFDSSASSTRANDNGLHSLSANDAYGIRGYISRGADGRARCNYTGDRGESSGDITCASGIVSWATTGTNVTSFTITGSSAGCFDVGATLKVWKLGVAGTESACVVGRHALQTITTAGALIDWDTEIYDTESYWSSSPNPTRITIPVSGWYCTAASVTQSTDPDDAQTLQLLKNGAAYSANIGHQTRLGLGTSIAAGSQVVDIDFYTAGDYLELWVDNRSGNSTVYARLSIIRISGPTGPTGPTGATGPVGATGQVELYSQAEDFEVISNTTLANTGLTSRELPPGTYSIEILAVSQCHATPDLKRRIQFTGTATDVALMFTTDGVASGSGYYTALGAATAGSHTTTGIHVTTLHGTITVTGAGVLSWQIAQNSSSATPIYLKKGSWMRITDITGAGGTDIDIEVAADSPVGYWKLDEASGNFVDSSGGGYTLTITGAPVTSYQFAAADPNFPSRKTAAATNGGQANYAASASALGLSLPITTYTMEAWGRWNSSGIIMALGANGETLATNFAGQMLVLAGGNLSQFWEYGAGTNAPTINAILGGILDGKLHHLVSVKDAASLTVSYYVDGIYVGGGTYTSGQEHTGGTSGVFSIMGTPGDSTAACDGLYSGAAFYTAALSEARIQAHARALGLFP